MMNPGDLIEDYYQYEYNGLLLGAGTLYQAIRVSGLIGYPALRSGTVDRFGNHGGSGGRHYMPHREFVLNFDYAVETDEEFAAARSELMTAFRPRVMPDDELPFVFWHPGAPDKMYIKARPVDFNAEVNRRFALKYPEHAVRFEATDPLHYGITEYSTSLGLQIDLTGLDLPMVFPLNFGPSSSDTVTLTNNGTAPATWKCNITGLVAGPRLEKVDTGEVLNFPNLTVQLGEYLLIDEFNRQVLLNGVSSRRGDMTSASKWFKLDPGETTTIRYANNGAASSSTATFYWHYAYWGES
jgi:tail protein